jgi:hypothetical protein
MEMMNNENKKMKHFDEWAKDKPPLISIPAFIVAYRVEDFLEFLKLLKVGKRIEGYHLLPSNEKWLKLYRNHRKINHGVVSGLKKINKNVAKFIEFYISMLECFSFAKEITSEEFKEIMEETPSEELQKEFIKYRNKFDEIKNYLMNFFKDEYGEEQELDEKEKKRIRAIMLTPEMIYYLRVWIPCYLMYGKYPIHLLRKARQADNKALEDLLRLDKSVIGDSRIKEILHQAAVAQQRGTMDIISKAISKTPKVTIKARKVKHILAGLLSLISIALGQKLKIAEIVGLYDAAARDMGKGNGDPDFIDKPWTIEKAIERGRSFWQIIPQADKK